VKSNDRQLKDLIDRHLKWPSHLSFTAARDRVREQLLATPAHLQTARVADAPPSIPMWRMAAAAAVVVIVVIGTAIFWPRGVQAYSAGDDGLQFFGAHGGQGLGVFVKQKKVAFQKSLPSWAIELIWNGSSSSSAGGRSNSP